MTGVSLKSFVVFDQRAGFVAVEPRHHDVHEDQVRLMICNLRQRIESVNGREYLATLLGSARFRRFGEWFCCRLLQES